MEVRIVYGLANNSRGLSSSTRVYPLSTESKRTSLTKIRQDAEAGAHGFGQKVLHSFDFPLSVVWKNGICRSGEGVQKERPCRLSISAG